VNAYLTPRGYTIPRGAMTGLAQDSGRHAPASDCTKTEGGIADCCHTTRSHSPATGGTHRPACARCRHTVRSRSRTHPQRWGAHTGKTTTGTQPRRRQARGQIAHTMSLLGPAKRERRRRKWARCPTAGSPAAKLRVPLPCTTIPSQHYLDAPIATAGHGPASRAMAAGQRPRA
jgi:hypothetical protein